MMSIDMGSINDDDNLMNQLKESYPEKDLLNFLPKEADIDSFEE